MQHPSPAQIDKETWRIRANKNVSLKHTFSRVSEGCLAQMLYETFWDGLAVGDNIKIKLDHSSYARGIVTGIRTTPIYKPSRQIKGGWAPRTESGKFTLSIEVDLSEGTEGRGIRINSDTWNSTRFNVWDTN